MTAQALPTNRNKIEELESIRGLAALLVVIFHIPKWNPILDIGLINNSYLMVELFFVLSGFVISNAYTNKIETGADLMRFQFLRFGRLYPVHLIFLLLFLAVEVAKYVALSKLGAQDIRKAPFTDNTLGAFVEQLFLVQAIGPTGNALTFNDPAWSISVEFYTYLVFGLAILFFKRVRTPLFSLIVLLSILLLETRATHGFTDLLRCLAGFFIGCLTAGLIRKTRATLPGYLSAIFFFSILIFLQLKTSKYLDVVIYFLTAALIASLMLSRGGLLRRILKHRILIWLGLVSYSVYMSHRFVLWVVTNAVKRLLKRPEVQAADGQWVLSLSVFETLAIAFGAILIVLLVSQMTYSMIEKPMRETSRRIAFGKLNRLDSTLTPS
jgi:peptidoglycan/LPS O-acetylase OafA/YrhL